MNKTRWMWIGTAIVAAALVLALAGAAALVVGRYIWGGIVQAQESSQAAPFGWRGWGPMGMMRWYWPDAPSAGSEYEAPCLAPPAVAATTGETLTIEQAREAVEEYISEYYGDGLEVEEVMEFSLNFYAIVEERDTGIGAMELLIDKDSGAVAPEYGPNMMWNTKYGMHGGMMGYRGAEVMTVSPEEALTLAQRWLDTYRPGNLTESHADPFYGYYTIHTLKDGEVSGMLSVHGGTGQVWYHNWHGDFVQMIGEEE